MTHAAFFGEREHAFALTHDQIIELESKTGAGIGSLCLRVPEGHFRHAELVEIIRLSLIGGGTTPQEAAALADTYAAKRPLSESFPIAIAVLQAVWSGAPAQADTAQDSADG
ncbi:MAG: gene transfer agent family protein [Mesorhizobium sp.]|uniref:gene transfer agent family protein n=1 Tax=Mesorhizobium sp. TaxID=1871066 RepID=UPI000FE67DDF|nr:gene transfer agent family protein [Mesorhizobium sp.]RWD50561.1 MAG: gene transfer agent family protein [Mesorhizobium sp.]RWE55775.1 MAG: gene transfer agent family protein [Mesorhizobium sp.]RWF09680.1 MAG: gene transfer agent family protein [Mesorhizobium sp.]RWF20929.1 MAG: gene transfer agent family protein [Mesorhizobium sp.]TIX86342.1 MAG: gene transfer agent family protein [Mesorhizobium sp.]